MEDIYLIFFYYALKNNYYDEKNEILNLYKIRYLKICKLKINLINIDSNNGCF